MCSCALPLASSSSRTASDVCGLPCTVPVVRGRQLSTQALGHLAWMDAQKHLPVVLHQQTHRDRDVRSKLLPHALVHGGLGADARKDGNPAEAGRPVDGDKRPQHQDQHLQYRT